MRSIDVHYTPLDVGLNNGRDYIQGSQIIACLVERLDAAERASWRLKRASFHKITDRIVCAALSSEVPDLNSHIGKVSFCNGHEQMHFLLTEANDRAPERKVEANRIEVIGLTAHGQSRYKYEGRSDFWSLLDVIIQACKRHVIESVFGSDRFMFTGLGFNSLPLAPDESWATGHLKIEQLRRLDRNGTAQTMNRFVIVAGDNATCEGVFGFAFRYES